LNEQIQNEIVPLPWQPDPLSDLMEQTSCPYDFICIQIYKF